MVERSSVGRADNKQKDTRVDRSGWPAHAGVEYWAQVRFHLNHLPAVCLDTYGFNLSL